MSTDPDSSDRSSSSQDASELGSSVFSEFLADYYVECGEHLATARRSILALEPLLGQATLDRGLLDELFRSFHSLKGLSAMVGFHEAEQLAHQLESFLSAVRRNEVRLEVTGLETLVSGVSTLEQIIAARRDAATVPDYSTLLKQVAALLPGGAASRPASPRAASAAPSIASLGPKEAAIAEKIRAGGKAWLVKFAPSSALVKQGVDVNFVRRKLQALGELIHSEPVVGSGGGISFSFVVVTGADQPPIDLEGEGLTCEPFELTQTVTAVLPTQAAAENEPSAHLTPANLVRVDLTRLDELMRMVGELVLSRARLEDGLRRLSPLIPGGQLRPLQETNSAIERQLRDLREGVMRVRMVPIREVFARMQFVVRDLVRELGKQATLRFTGEETQIDKYVVERIMDPLLHLVRNAASHGLEPAGERLAAGKSAAGHIDLRARTTGETVVIEVEDDGRGIDGAAVLARAQARGFAPPLPAAAANPLLDVLCIPGFSTQEQPDRASGRGVGMDVVRSAVEEMGGSLAMETQLGQGTRFIIQLPLTLAITEALIVKVGDQRFAVPQVAVREVLQSETGRSTFLENNELLRYHGGVLPLIRLEQLFGLGTIPSGNFYALVVGEGVHTAGLVVDRVLGLREVVVRPLTDRLVQVAGVAGATELGDGQVVLILDVANLFRLARRQTVAPPALVTSSAEPLAPIPS
jgi:two-component system chemotaxis sensor kinase CheA